METVDPPLLVETGAAKRARVTPSPADQGLLRRVRNSLADGSPGRALRQLMSDSIHSAQDPAVWAKLQDLHPEPLASSGTGPPGVLDPGVEAEDPQALWEGLDRDAIARFPKGAAPGPSGLRASHIQDAVRRPGRGTPLVQALASLAQAWVNGTLPLEHAPFFTGANLTPLRKKDGGVRPVAVGEVLRRLVGKALLAIVCVVV